MGVNRVTVRKADVNVHKLMVALTHAKSVKVGFPEETTGAQEHSESGLPVATIAAFNELGTENSPPRPFMRQGAEVMVKRRGLLVPHVKRMVSGAMHGDAFMIATGMLLKGSIEAAVKGQDFAPLAASTVRAKGSTEILVDSGEMLDKLDVHLDRLG